MNAGSTLIFLFLYVGLQYVSFYVYMSDDLMFSLCYGYGARLSAASKVGKKFFFSLFAKRYFFSGRICVGFGPKTKTGVFEQSFQGRVSFFWCPLSPPPGPSHVTYLEWGDGG